MTLQGKTTLKSVLKSSVLAAGACILVVGFAIAQTAPAPAPAAPAPQAQGSGGPGAGQGRGMGNGRMREMAQACRSEVDQSLRGRERRDAMVKCMDKKRSDAGMPSRADQRKAQMERREARHQQRDKARDARNSCREELKDQRFTMAERRKAMQDCIAKKDPVSGKRMGCMTQAEEKKLTRGSREFRDFMRQCNQAQ